MSMLLECSTAGEVSCEEDTRDYSSPFEPTTAHQAWWLGFSLGLEGLDVESPGHFDNEMRVEFDRGFASGYDGFIGGQEEDAAEYAAWLDSIRPSDPGYYELAEAGWDAKARMEG